MAKAMNTSAKKIAFKGRVPYCGGDGTMLVDETESGEGFSDTAGR